MIAKRAFLPFFAAMLASVGTWTAAQEKSASPQTESVVAASTASVTSRDSKPAKSNAAKTETPLKNDGAERFEGEKRFRANCGRCHVAPHKFPPRMMATIVRHMRVRATITDEDMHLILLYMTQ